jgi:hypothetical protein
MKTGKENYDKVLDLLKNSRPGLKSTDEVETEVLKRISGDKQPKLNLSEILDFLFGWVYIGWVRKSLITASVLLVFFFVYQQGLILKQINYLSRQIIVNSAETATSPELQIEKLRMMYKRSGMGFPSRNISITEKQMDELLNSVNELKTKYKDLDDLIERDPELKEMIEKKLIENNRTKVNL